MIMIAVFIVLQVEVLCDELVNYAHILSVLIGLCLVDTVFITLIESFCSDLARSDYEGEVCSILVVPGVAFNINLTPTS